MEHSPLNAFVRRHNKSLAIIGAGCLLLLMMIIRIPIYTTFQRVDLDFSWEMDLAHKLQDHEIAGRDFYFTYGPGSQIIYSLSGLLRPDASPIDRAPLTYLILRIVLVTLLMACVWLVPNLDWRTALIVMLIFTLGTIIGPGEMMALGTVSIRWSAAICATRRTTTQNQVLRFSIVRASQPQKWAVKRDLIPTNR